MEMPRVTIIAIGNELLSGAVVDSNTAHLAGELKRLGFIVQGGCIVPDELDPIIAALKNAVAQSDLVLVSGGLGPTSDDITRDAIAKFLNVPLEKNAASLERITKKAEAKNRQVTANEEQQGYFPKGGFIIPNPVGTADSFRCVYSDGKREVSIVALPGVPRELKEIFKVFVRPWALDSFARLIESPVLYLKCFGIPESYLGSIIDKLDISPAVHVSYRPMSPLILLTLTLREPGDSTLLKDAALKIDEAIGQKFIFAHDAESTMSEVVGRLLIERQLTIAFAESCSGGKLADLTVSTSGAATYFLASIVSYSNEVKEKMLGVSPVTLKNYGAVSSEVAVEMVRGVAEKTGASIAVSITGLAGPDGGSEAKPVGTVYFGYHSPTQQRVVKVCYPSERNIFRTYCATYALDLIRRDLLDLPFPEGSK